MREFGDWVKLLTNVRVRQHSTKALASTTSARLPTGRLPSRFLHQYDQLSRNPPKTHLIGLLRKFNPAVRIIAMSGGGILHSDYYLNIARIIGAN